MLTETQIQQLFDFCEKKRVRYYDIQVELVDHLANGIEQKMIADPTISFENALNELYDSFGIFGFAKVVQEKEAANYQQQKKLFYTILRDRFRWPKVLLLITLLGVFYFLFDQFKTSISIIFISLLVSSFAILIWEIIKRSNTKAKKKILLNEFRVKFTFFSNPIMINLFINDLCLKERNIFFFSKYPIIPALIASLIILDLTLNHELKKKIDLEIAQKFPGIFTS